MLVPAHLPTHPNTLYDLWQYRANPVGNYTQVPFGSPFILTPSLFSFPVRLAPIMNINELTSPGHEEASPQAKAIKRGYPSTAAIIEKEYMMRRQAAWVAAGVASRQPCRSNKRCLAGLWTMTNTEGQEFKYTWEHTAGSPDLRGKQVFSGGGVSIPVYGTLDKAGTVTWVCDGKKMKPVKCEAVVEGENDGQVHSGVYWRLDGKGNKTARLGEFTGVRTQAPSDTLR